MINYLSIDFESWVYPDIPQFKLLSNEKRKKLDKGYVKYSAQKILDLLGKNRTKITFFIVAQLYEWYPETIEMVAEEGHEIAYHTHAHDLLHSKDILISTLNQSKKFLKRFQPKGFRAPNIFFKKNYMKILKNYAFKYDSSTYGDYKDINHTYGLTEIPITKFANIPIGSGYFIGLLGKNIDWFYKIINRQDKPVIAFIHNWQIIKPHNATFPNISYLLTHPHYLPYSKEVFNTFEYLLQHYSFKPMKNLLKI